jgi:hypothetical protein
MPALACIGQADAPKLGRLMLLPANSPSSGR